MLAPRHSRKDGFTLVELICVVVIIGILSSLAIPGWNRIIRMIVLSDCEQQISAYNRAVIGFYANHGSLPLTVGAIENDGLVSVLACPRTAHRTAETLHLSKRQEGRLEVEETSIAIGLLLVGIVRFSTEVAMACMHSSGLAHTTTALTEIGALAPASMLRQPLPKSQDINTS